MKFNVGDRVTAEGNVTGFNGAGTITDIDENSLRYTYRIRFDDYPESRIWAYTNSVRPLGCANKILITSDGHTTTARLYDGKKVIKSAGAKCSLDDKFDFSTGAKLAFDRLMGTEKPKEAKLEPIKLYCVKEYEPGEFLTRGKVYEIPHDGGFIPFDDGWRDMISFAETRLCGELVVPTYLVPLVSRPAKVGEWVYINIAFPLSGQAYKKGDVFKCSKSAVLCVGDIFVEGQPGLIDTDEYLVLDGYDGRYEEPEKPKYWSGKVVCVETHDVGFVSGAIYSVIGGALRDKDGEFRPNRSGAAFFRKFDDLSSSAYGKFIEFKGEADER